MELGKLYATGHSVVIAIPAPLRSELGWKPGDAVWLSVQSGGQLVVQRVKEPAARRTKKSVAAQKLR
jgi:AbrB family looped-hinge helix DNA binding protein